MAKKTQTKKVEFSFVEIVGIVLMAIFVILIIASSLLAQKDLHRYRGPNFHTTDNLRCTGELNCYTKQIVDLSLNEPIQIGDYHFEIIGGDFTNLSYITMDINGEQLQTYPGDDYFVADISDGTINYRVRCLSMNNSDDPWYSFQGKFIIEVKHSTDATLDSGLKKYKIPMSYIINKEDLP